MTRPDGMTQVLTAVIEFISKGLGMVAHLLQGATPRTHNPAILTFKNVLIPAFLNHPRKWLRFFNADYTE